MSPRPPFKFSASTRVGFSDTDAQGIVYYGRYMPYFDLARVEYHRALDMLRTGPEGEQFVARALRVEYLAPARFDDELEVFVRVLRIGTTSMVWQFEAVNVATSEHLATAQQTLVQVDLASRRPVPVSGRLRSAIRGFDQEVETA